ncbi:peptidoglycan editing factor PgeF [Crassaminicella indica]|uniref:Purine nucleoside phosphorylase n=2 Tax=Crassaminicella indica TaxID=2855394 RepID=A0ABX8RFA1_9CLOT|nr:peptidoglycan editing factor PgeF [Crassaminicella indica]
MLYYSIPSFDETKLVKNCFTSRIGGVSKGQYETLNLGLKTDDLRENIIENFRLLCEGLEISINHLVFSDQIHGDNIKIVRKEDRGKGIIKDSDIIGVDALITNEKKIALVTVYADCVPIFLLDPVNKVIALAHAGWRGTVLKIGQKVIKKMVEEFKTNPQDCLAAIGPSIGKCCYEVDEGVIDEFNKNFTNLDKFVFFKGNSKYMLDLWQANKITLEEIGVLERNITISNMCTMCNQEVLFSYRGDKGVTGRMAAIMELI